MLKPRITPCLLIQDGGLVKTTKFEDPKYIGDPINAVRIFNEKEADELIVLDIDASAKGVEPDFNMIENLAKECMMPLCYGGGVREINDFIKLIDVGVEKISINQQALNCPEFIKLASERIGSQSVVVTIDLKIDPTTPNKIIGVSNSLGHIVPDLNPLEYVQKIQNFGCGELILNFVDLDGTRKGYNIKYLEKILPIIDIPVTICGGADGYNDFLNISMIIPY